MNILVNETERRYWVNAPFGIPDFFDTEDFGVDEEEKETSMTPKGDTHEHENKKVFSYQTLNIQDWEYEYE